MRLAFASLLATGCLDAAPEPTHVVLPALEATSAAPTARKLVDPDRERCLAIIDSMTPAPDVDTAIVPLEWGWTIAAGPWSRYNVDLVIVEDVFRFEGRVGALTIHLHDGAVSCMWRDELGP